jgi:FkbM family methyltransferase
VYSLIAAKRHQGRVRVVAVEPGYANFAALCENIVLNGCSRWITPLPVPVSSTTTLGMFSYSSLEPGAADHNPRRTGPINSVGSAYQQPMLTYRLDDLISTFGLPRPNHIKLDVDGAEGAVVSGAIETLRDAALRSLLIEIAKDQTDRVVSLLSESGLELRERFERSAAPVWYGIFVRLDRS